MGNVTRQVEDADHSLVAAGVGGANQQEDPTSDVQLRPSDCADDFDLYLDESVGVESQRPEGGKAKDVHLGLCVCNGLGDDLGCLTWAAELHRMWVMGFPILRFS